MDDVNMTEDNQEFIPHFEFEFNEENVDMETLVVKDFNQEKILEEVEFEDAGDAKNAVGVFLPSSGTGAGVGKNSIIPNTVRGEQAIARAKRLLNCIAFSKQIGGNETMVTGALAYYKILLRMGKTHARTTLYVCAALLYIVCRVKNTTHLLIDFSEATRSDIFVLGRIYTFICHTLLIVPPLIDPCLLVERYGYKLNLGEKNRDICHTAVRIVGHMKRDWIHVGRRPNGICGAALLVAGNLHGIPISIKKVISAVRISKAVIMKRLLDVKNTETSALTLEDITTKKIESLVEKDPPSFTQSRENFLRRTELEQKNGWLSQSVIDQVVKTHKQIDVIMGIRETIKIGIDGADKTGSLMPTSSPRKPPKESDKNSNAASSPVTKPIIAFSTPSCVSSVNDPEIDDSEIDAMILNEEEVAMKTKVWYEENADYLKEQEEKAKKAALDQILKRTRKSKRPRVRKPAIPERVMNNLVQTAKNSLKQLNSTGQRSNRHLDGRLHLDDCDDDFEKESTLCIDIMIDKKLRRKLTSTGISENNSEIHSVGKQTPSICASPQIPTLDSKNIFNYLNNGIGDHGSLNCGKDMNFMNRDNLEENAYFQPYNDEHSNQIQFPPTDNGAPESSVDLSNPKDSKDKMQFENDINNDFMDCIGFYDDSLL